MQTILVGHVLDRLRDLPDQSVQTCITSPPYYGLRDYGVEGQIGLETTIAEYLETMVEVFREVWRVLRDDGTLWLNLGDSYNANQGKGFDTNQDGGLRKAAAASPRVNTGLAPKQLLGMPWRVAFALQADGWYLRSDIIWAKPNPMPESVTDRPTRSHEYLFLLTKRPRYYYDQEAVKEPTSPHSKFNKREVKEPFPSSFGHHRKNLGYGSVGSPDGRNLRSVWAIATHPFPAAHFATFPPALVEKPIKAGTSEYGVCNACGAPWERLVNKDYQSPIITTGVEDGRFVAGRNRNVKRMGDGVNVTTIGWQATCGCSGHPVPATVLDPFVGSGTTLLVAERLGRNGIGIELNADYAELARKRIHDESPMHYEVEVR